MKPQFPKGQLFIVAFAVRPLPGDPLFGEIQWQTLNVWLVASDPESATTAAREIVGRLTVELCTQKCQCTPGSDWRGLQPQAVQFDITHRGYCLSASSAPIGSNEPDFEKLFEPL